MMAVKDIIIKSKSENLEILSDISLLSSKSFKHKIYTASKPARWKCILHKDC